MQQRVDWSVQLLVAMVQVSYIAQFGRYIIYSLGPAALSCVNNIVTYTLICNLYITLYTAMSIKLETTV